jgi:septum formation protein
MQLQPQLILASSSPRRKELLQSLGLQFSVIPSSASEEISGGAEPQEFVKILAERKAIDVATHIAVSNTPTVVIGADTIVVRDGVILGKPHHAQHAIEMLNQLQGQTHEVYTGICVLGVNQDIEQKFTDYVSTKVTMRALSMLEIERYVDTGEPMDKAGAYAVQGLGSTLITHINGDYFTVVGLPLALLSHYLNHFDIHPF